MNTINVCFEKNETVEIAKECVLSCHKIMLEKYSLIVCRGADFGYDPQNGDVLFFFDGGLFQSSDKDKYKIEFLYLLREAWKEAGFSIIEEKTCKAEECPIIKYPSYFFRLRKRNVICQCALCRYSEYGRCSNPNILAEFENLTLVNEITIESSRFNCFQFSECSDVYDVE